MKKDKKDRKTARLRRHRRTRKKVFGTSARPRLCVYRSNSGIYAQIIDDTKAVTIIAASSIDKELRGKIKAGSNKEAAARVGELVAKRALEKKVRTVVFDRGGNIYHGRVKELAEAARKQGLKF